MSGLFGKASMQLPFVKDNFVFNGCWLERTPNMLAKILPEKAKYEDVIKVCDIDDSELQIIADVVAQKVVCLFA